MQDSKLERVHDKTIQDLHNIAASYNISGKLPRHKNDAINVEAWVQEVRESSVWCGFTSLKEHPIKSTQNRGSEVSF